MDIEWAKDGQHRRAVHCPGPARNGRSRAKTRCTWKPFGSSSGAGARYRAAASARKLPTGPVRVIKSVQIHLDEFKQGEVLVTDKTDPDWEPIMKKAGAIITNRGGRTCHAAIVSRELGVPAIVGTEHGTEVLKDGQVVTVSAPKATRVLFTRADSRSTCSGRISRNLARPRTKVMMNVGNPEEAFALSFIPNDGVGLAREEFIITTYIKMHPLALLELRQDRRCRQREDADRRAHRGLRRTSRSSSSINSRKASR